MSKYMLFALLPAVLLLSVAARAETMCPWINAATASGILEGAVSPGAQGAGGNSGICFFQSSSKDSLRSLRIVVRNKEDGREIMGYESQCGSHREQLSGIGNDALLCDIDTLSWQGVQVTGRVRDMIFAVRIEGRDENPKMMKKMLREKAIIAAEQVAGNLF